MEKSSDEAHHPVIAVQSRMSRGKVYSLDSIEVFGNSPFHHVSPADSILTERKVKFLQ